MAYRLNNIDLILLYVSTNAKRSTIHWFYDYILANHSRWFIHIYKIPHIMTTRTVVIKTNSLSFELSEGGG